MNIGRHNFIRWDHSFSTYANQGVRNVEFLENFAHVLNDPFADFIRFGALTIPYPGRIAWSLLDFIFSYLLPY